MEEKTESNLSRLDKNNNSLPKTERVRRGFSALQKTIAFVGSILSLVIASFTINNNLSKTQNPTPNSSEIVKVVEKSSEKENSSSKESTPSLGGKKESSEKHYEHGTQLQSEPATKEVIREIIREKEPAETKSEQKEKTETQKEGSVTEKTENKTANNLPGTGSTNSSETKKEEVVNSETRTDKSSLDNIAAQ